MKTQNSKLAFSLIEISIVILIIGILVIGITKGSRIIRASKLRTAQNLTNSSPVASTEGVMLWYESTLDKSFATSEAVDTPFASQGTIATWNDINPQSTSLSNATQATATNKPRYSVNSINGLPAVNFDGNDNYLSFDGTKLANTNYSVFVVEQRRDGGLRLFIGGSSYPGTNQNFHLGYRDNTNSTFAQYGNDWNVTVDGYSSLVPRIHSVRFSSTKGKNYYINGILKTLIVAGGTPSETTGLTSNIGAKIGAITVDAGPDYYYFGDIGEIIMFTRYLTDSERLNIEKYLKTKWGIK